MLDMEVVPCEEAPIHMDDQVNSVDQKTCMAITVTMEYFHPKTSRNGIAMMPRRESKVTSKRCMVAWRGLRHHWKKTNCFHLAPSDREVQVREVVLEE
jgi:hypothetical protein